MAYGSISVDQINNTTGYSLGAGNATQMKNRLINGAMVIDQRNNGSSVTPAAGDFSLDRWSFSATQSSKVTIQRNAGSVTPPAGFTNYLGVTSTSAYSIGAGDWFTINQPIEGFNTFDLGFGTANAKVVTLSFWVRSSLTGTFGGAINNTDNTRNYPYTYTITNANTWEYKTVTLTGDTTGTWDGATNGRGMYVRFGLGVGSTYSAAAGSWTATSTVLSATGATSVVGTNGATWYITGVQLEVGSSATGFEYRHYGQELALCQRYYYLLNSYAMTGAATVIGPCGLYSATDLRLIGTFPVTMRTSPSLNQGSGSSYYTLYSDGNGYSFNSFSSVVAHTTQTYELVANSGFTASAGKAGWVNSATNGAYVAFSAEL